MIKNDTAVEKRRFYSNIMHTCNFLSCCKFRTNLVVPPCLKSGFRSHVTECLYWALTSITTTQCQQAAEPLEKSKRQLSADATHIGDSIQKRLHFCSSSQCWEGYLQKHYFIRPSFIRYCYILKNTKAEEGNWLRNSVFGVPVRHKNQDVLNLWSRHWAWESPFLADLAVSISFETLPHNKQDCVVYAQSFYAFFNKTDVSQLIECDRETRHLDEPVSVVQ